MLDEKNNSVLGQKRKWADDTRKQSQSNKKQKQDALDGDDSDSSDDAASEHENEGAQIEAFGPSKVVYQEKSINFQAKLAFVDFAGLHDQRSLQMLIPLINPKKLILVGGSAAETGALANDCRELLGVKIVGHENESKSEVFLPQIGDTIDASVDTNAWTVKLTRDLVKRLHWQNVRDISIVTITGQLRTEAQQAEAATTVKKLKLEDSAKNEKEIPDLKPVLDAIPASVAASIRDVAQPIHVGDLRLQDLRRIMKEAGHSANFRGEGTLLIDELIAVRKLPTGRVVVEGPPVRGNVDSFTRVKRMIYDGLAVVAAG